jgi:hypothetical protein
MKITEPKRPDSEPLITDEERKVYTERLKTLEQDRKTARPSDEVFRRILQEPKL